MRRAIVPAAVRKRYLGEVERMMEEFHLDPTLYRLLKGGGAPGLMPRFEEEKVRWLRYCVVFCGERDVLAEPLGRDKRIRFLLSLKLDFREHERGKRSLKYIQLNGIFFRERNQIAALLESEDRQFFLLNG